MLNSCKALIKDELFGTSYPGTVVKYIRKTNHTVDLHFRKCLYAALNTQNGDTTNSWNLESCYQYKHYENRNTFLEFAKKSFSSFCENTLQLPSWSMSVEIQMKRRETALSIYPLWWNIQLQMSEGVKRIQCLCFWGAI